MGRLPFSTSSLSRWDEATGSGGAESGTGSAGPPVSGREKRVCPSSFLPFVSERRRPSHFSCRKSWPVLVVSRNAHDGATERSAAVMTFAQYPSPFFSLLFLSLLPPDGLRGESVVISAADPLFHVRRVQEVHDELGERSQLSWSSAGSPSLPFTPHTSFRMNSMVFSAVSGPSVSSCPRTFTTKDAKRASCHEHELSFVLAFVCPRTFSFCHLAP